MGPSERMARRVQLHGARYSLGFVEGRDDPGWSLRGALSWLLTVTGVLLAGAWTALVLRHRR